MNSNLFGIVILGIIGGLIYKYHDTIKIEYMKYKTNILAEKITIDYFEKLINKNNNITLDEAILKFEHADNTFNSLEEFSKSKHRSINNYREAYGHLFLEAQKKIK
jgi:hypothetical protein